MHLILSETGSIVAELGIIYAQSSVTNCILYGENKSCQVMIGALQENPNHMDYILRVSGISPIVGFATAISRKIFVNSGWMIDIFDIHFIKWNQIWHCYCEFYLCRSDPANHQKWIFESFPSDHQCWANFITQLNWKGF